MSKAIYIIIVITIFLIVFVGFFSGYLNNREIEITITDKYVKRNNDKDIYLIVDENKNTYKVSDLFFKFKFNSTDIYNNLEIGKTYKVKISGFRIKILSEYPNINEIIKEEK